MEAQLRTSKLGPSHYQKVESIKNKLIKIQDLYIDGDMDKKDYQQAKKRYTDIQEELKEIEGNQQKELFKTYKEGLNNLQNFDKQYIEGNIDNKRLLTGLIFPNKFGFENQKIQTANVNPLLLKIASINRGYKVNKKRDTLQKKKLSRLVDLQGLEP